MIDPMRRRPALALVLLAILLGAFYAWREFSRKAAAVDELPVVATVTAPELLHAFMADEEAATARFVGTTGQVVQVSGTIRAVEPAGDGRTNVLLDAGEEMSGVVCEFVRASLPAGTGPGESITIKGVCTGYLMDVVLVRCMVVD